jgi:Peptidase family M1 domain
MVRPGFLFTGWLLLLATGLPFTVYAEEPIRHDMDVVFQPDNNSLQVEDTITLPESLLAVSGRKLTFLLHAGLRPISPTPGIKLSRQTGRKKSAPSAQEPQRATERYAVALPSGRRDFVIKYRGRVDPPASDQSSDHTADFDAGTISSKGIFLNGSTRWYPWFNDDLITYTLEVRLPEPWDAVSQGERTRHENKGATVETRWESPEPQDEIFLIGGRFTEYDRPAGSIQVMAFLRTPDEELAKRYLEAGGSYLEMYQNLLGPYPYKKFALVENFWETGYGMPSLTLLGSAVIRLSFILFSSYPHEILHNWWGNGVFVNDEKGNWSEGLTTYLADHLIQEQHGTGPEYRRAALQKYADYVAEGKDFPLTEFRSRYSPATEAVGYGKTMMFFHMLRRRLGDEIFMKALRKFYRDNRFRRATFDDLRAAFSAVAGEDFKNDFNQWIERAGAPALHVSGARTRVKDNGYLLSALLDQTQPGPAYRLRVPVAVTIEGREPAYQTTVLMTNRHLDIELPVPGRPLRLDVDPEFDLFRRLDRDELPPALSQPLGSDRILFLIPSSAKEAVRRGYRRFAESLSTFWQRSPSVSIEINLDREFDALPSDRAVWILGWENRYLPNFRTASAGHKLSLSQNDLQIGDAKIGRSHHAFVLTARQPQYPDAALAWVAADSVASLPGLARKLPHYGPYSYVVFEGEDPVNILKGQWDVQASPLSIPVVQPEGQVRPTTRAKLEPRRALTE